MGRRCHDSWAVNHYAAPNEDRKLLDILEPMEQTVEIPVEVGGVERVFTAQVQAWRYGVRFLVDVDGVEVILERDDGGEFRAILPEGFSGKAPNKAVIGAIIDVLNVL